MAQQQHSADWAEDLPLRELLDELKVTLVLLKPEGVKSTPFNPNEQK